MRGTPRCGANSSSPNSDGSSTAGARRPCSRVRGGCRPSSDGAGLHDAAPDIGQRHAADHHAVSIAEDDEGIGNGRRDVLGNSGAKRRRNPAGSDRRTADRLPGRQSKARLYSRSCGPLRESEHFARAAASSRGRRHERGRSAGWQTKQAMPKLPALLLLAPLLRGEVTERDSPADLSSSCSQCSSVFAF